MKEIEKHVSYECIKCGNCCRAGLEISICKSDVERWIDAEKLYGILHILGGLTLLYVPMVDNPVTFFITRDITFQDNVPSLSKFSFISSASFNVCFEAA